MDRARVTELYAARQRGDVSHLLDALRDPEHRIVAIAHLGELRARVAVDPLITLLGAGDRGTQSGAAEVLGQLGAVEAVPALIDLARGGQYVVPRTYAIMALGRIRDTRSLSPLCDLLNDSNIVIRQAAVRALGVFGDHCAIEPLQQASKKERWYSRGIYRQAIRRIKSTDATPRA